LQTGCPSRRWVLKSPDHIYSLDKLLRAFPDAVIIQTHRNPVEVVKSQFRLTKVLEAMFARPRENEQLAMSEARKIEQIRKKNFDYNGSNGWRKKSRPLNFQFFFAQQIPRPVPEKPILGKGFALDTRYSAPCPQMRSPQLSPFDHGDEQIGMCL